MITVLVTGANGLIGRPLCRALLDAGMRVRAALRNRGSAGVLGAEGDIELAFCGDLSAGLDWTAVVAGVDVVVHLAARVHVMAETAADPEEAFGAVNVDATMALARAAKAAGARRFIYLSSIKVNGECTSRAPFRFDDDPAPADAYARSKLRAESGLLELSHDSFEVAIVRPPLVYGAGVSANFRALLGLASGRIPLPIASIRNARSFVSTWNLCDFLCMLARWPKSARGIWLVSDGEDLSTPDLFSCLAQVPGRGTPMFRMPVVILRAAAALLGKSDQIRRLTESLQVDIGPTTDYFGWQPPVPVREGLRRTARAYREPLERPRSGDGH